MVRKKASSQQSRQAPPIWPERKSSAYPAVGKNRLPVSLSGKGRKKAPDYLPLPLQKMGESLRSRRKGGVPQTFKRKGLVLPPSPIPVAWRDPQLSSIARQCLAHPFFFSGHDAFRKLPIARRVPFMFSGTDALENLESQSADALKTSFARSAPLSLNHFWRWFSRKTCPLSLNPF